MQTRPFLALAILALLAACQEETPAEDGTATGQVLEGSISDEMLPVDTVRSEPPLEDPEAFREVLEEAAEAAPAGAAAGENAEGAAEDSGDDSDASEPPAAEPAPPAED